MLQRHFPFAALALLAGSLGAGSLLVTAMCAMLVILWLPLVYGSTRLGVTPVSKLSKVKIRADESTKRNQRDE